MEAWKPVKDGGQGIAVQNFRQEGHFRIKINVGERVNIIEENGDWYFGCLVNNEDIKGIFPKSYVHLQRLPTLQGHDAHNQRMKKQMDFGIFNEIVQVWREWSPIWKQLYVKRDNNVMKIKNMMYDLISYRNAVLSGRLLKHQLMELRYLIASIIDFGNKLLGLDMVVRDEEGNILPVKTTSAMRLFKEHELASARVRHSMESMNLLSMKDLTEDKKHYSNTLLISIMNFICIVEEDLELVLTLYDAVAECPISDNFVFLWKPNIFHEDTEKLQQLKVLFTDLVQQDIMNKQIYLVCYTIRIGSAEQREAEYVRSLEEQATPTNDQKNTRTKIKVRCKRRPFGIAAVDVSSYLKICAEDHEEDHLFLPLLRYSEGSMKGLLNRIINIKETALEECVGQGLWIRLKLFNRNLREVITLNHLKMENIIQTQKIGLPEVIMPTNVRNEFYLTIIGGEFYRFLAPEKNVEVSVSVCHEDGKVISGAIQMGNNYLKEYRSIIYYRENKPEWYETIKINMPLNGFRGYHLKFTFNHRSANYTAEKPFALSYINIMKEFGTLIQDGKHVLNLFMIDHRKFEEGSCSYLSLPVKTSDVEMKKYHVRGLKLNEKDRFFIKTYVCSTHLTQNVSLLRLLDWMNSNHQLLESLQAFLKVDGSEIMKFLPDILDALFKILEEDLELKSYGVAVFDCLVHVLDLFSNEKYKHFLPVLNVYIEEIYNAPLAYKKLTAILKLHLTNCSLSTDIRLKIMKSLYHYGRLILKSRKLYNSCTLEKFIRSFGILDANYNIMIINEIAQSKIFLLPKCRLILTPAMLEKIMEYLNGNVEVELSVNCLNGLLEPLQQMNFDDSTANTQVLMLSLLEYVIEAIIRVERGTVMTGKLLALMIEILRQMTPESFEWYKNYFSTDEELLDFLMAMLIFFQELVSRPVFSSDWLEMLMLQNSVILKSLKCIASIMKDKFLEPFNDQIWNNYFHSAVAYLTQSSLQLENFSEKKCSQILLAYMDMRQELAYVVKDTWSIMGIYQRIFTPSLVGPFLEMALIPNAELQKVIIPFFFDMAQCEFYSELSIEESNLHSTEPYIHHKCKFYEVELEIECKFDMLIEGGKGDEYFKDQFCKILNPMFEHCEPMKNEGIRFMIGVKEQLEKLLECRYYIKDNSDNGMVCLYQLLNFYSKRNCKELYIRYVNKLCELHIKNRNYAEAAKTLNLHAQLLDWSCNAVSHDLRCSRYPTYQTNFKLKEILYCEIIEHFDQGKLWYCAIKFCQELSEVYENKVYDYCKLAGVLRQKSNFFEKIMTSSFPEIEYFYVSYSGLGFPAFLQNKTFVYRGNDFEGYQNFCSRIKNQFPKAHLMKDVQGEGATSSSQQYIQITKVFPVFDETDEYPLLHIREQILYHLHGHDIQKFRFPSSLKINAECTLIDDQYISETENTGESVICKENSRTFTNLNSRTVVKTSQSFPWCLKLSPVTSVFTNEICPVWNAIEEIRTINRSLFGILPFEDNILQNLKYVSLKLEEIVSSCFVERLSKEIKVIMEENRGDLHLLKKLEGILIEQMNLVSVLIQNFDSLDSLPKLLHYLKRCVKKLTIFSIRVSQNPSISIKPREGIAESETSIQSPLKNESVKRRKTKSPKSLLFFRDSYELRDGNSLWYIPPPSSKLDEISFASQNSTNLGNSKSVFHVPTPVSSKIPSGLSSPTYKGFPYEPSCDDSSSGSSNGEVYDGITIQNDQETVDDLKRNVNFTFGRHEHSIPGKQNATTSSKMQLQINDVDADVPPPLPPKTRDKIKSLSDAASLVDVKKGGAFKTQDYVNLPGDDGASDSVLMHEKNAQLV